MLFAVVEWCPISNQTISC